MRGGRIRYKRRAIKNKRRGRGFDTGVAVLALLLFCVLFAAGWLVWLFFSGRLLF